MSNLLEIYKIRFAELGNSIIYFLKKIPLVRRLIKDSFYRLDKVKTFFGIIGFTLSFLVNLLPYIVLSALFFIVPWLCLGTSSEFSRTGLFATCYIFFILGSSITGSHFFENHEDGYRIIHIMKMEAKDFFLSKYLTKCIYMIIGFNISFIIIGLCFRIDLVLTVFFGMLVPFINAIFCALNIFIYKQKKNFLRRRFIEVITMFVFVSIGILLVALRIFIPGYLVFNPIFLGIISLGSIFGIVYLVKMDDGTYKRLFYESYERIKNATISSQDNAKEALFASVKLKEKDMNAVKESRLEKFHGFEYLNQIFFKRHRRVINRELLIKIGIILLISIGILFMGIINEEPQNKIFDLGQIVGAITLIAYFLMLGNNLTKALFHNCDISLLHYAFYREKRVILSNFWFRFKKLLTYNLLITLCLDIAITLFIHFFSFGLNSIEYFLVLGTSFILCVFFTIYYLFMYYIFQPYTVELSIKNPFYSLISTAIYLLSFGCFNADFDGALLVLLIFCFTTVFSGVAFSLVYLVSYKTFRLK